MNKKNQKRILDFCENNFGIQFSEAYKKIYISGKPNILMFADNFFKKWLYCVLYENINMTTFDIIEKLQDKNNDCIVVPRIRFNNYKVFKGMYFEMVNVCLENHPVVDDMEVLTNKIIREGSFNEDNIPDKNTFIKFADMLSIQDSFYIAYLIEIALEMDLIREMDSINIKKFFLTEKGRMNITDKKAFFNDIIDASIKLCIDNLKIIFNYNEGINKSMIYYWIKKRKSIDNIFADLYKLIDVNIKELWLYEPDEFDEIDDMIMASTFYTGVALDRWFLTPFGHYFQLIKPVYTVKTPMRDDIRFALEEYNTTDNRDVSCGVFMPCTAFELSCLGEKYFGIKKNNCSEILEKINASDVIDMLSYDENKFLKLVDGKQLFIKCFEYVFDLYVNNEEIFLFSLSVDENTSLQAFHVIIWRKFNYKHTDCFSFFVDEISPFTEYSPESVSKNTIETNLKDLNLRPGSKLIYNPVFEGNKKNCNYNDAIITCKLREINLK